MNKDLRVTHCQAVITEDEKKVTRGRLAKPEALKEGQRVCGREIWYNVNYVDEVPKLCERHSAESNETDYNFQRELEEWEERCKKCNTPKVLVDQARKRILENKKKEGLKKTQLKQTKKYRNMTFRDQYEIGNYGSDLKALGNLTVSIPKRPK